MTSLDEGYVHGMTPSADIHRREFCRIIGCAALGVCVGGLTGCSQLLQWSQGQGGQATKLPLGAPEPASSSSATSSASPNPPRPDLVVRTGNDPASNVRSALEPLGGMGAFVKRGAKVLIKPNLFIAREPKYAVTTNPQLVGALVTLALEAGAGSVTVVDRSCADDAEAFAASGIRTAVEQAGGSVKVLAEQHVQKVALPKGRLLTSVSLISDLFDADVIINAPIAKTHSLAGLTMSMKNLMGVIGGNRGEIMHPDLHTRICDLNTAVRPHLVVLDAYRILTAHGPTGGNLADVSTTKTVIVGTNQASVDAFGTTLFGMKPTDLEYLVQAAQRGMGVIDLDRLRIDKAAV
jgi:uncharacterized protein (DUF362 family)